MKGRLLADNARWLATASAMATWVHVEKGDVAGERAAAFVRQAFELMADQHGADELETAVMVAKVQIVAEGLELADRMASGGAANDP